jgi:Domain of unknown function (DUF4156)
MDETRHRTVRGIASRIALAMLALLAASSLDACTTGLSQGGRAIVVLGTAPRARCRILGPVFADGSGLTPARQMESAMNDLRNKAADLGGTHLLVQHQQIAQQQSAIVTRGGLVPITSSSAVMTGVAYRCLGRGPVEAVGVR